MYTKEYLSFIQYAKSQGVNLNFTRTQYLVVTDILEKISKGTLSKKTLLLLLNHSK